MVSLRKFWVKSVLSSPIPPCRLIKPIKDYKVGYSQCFRMPQDFSTWTHPTVIDDMQIKCANKNYKSQLKTNNKIKT